MAKRRVTCPWCKRDVSTRKNGRLYAHGWTDFDNTACEGSGQYPEHLTCCRGNCDKEVTDIDVLEGREYPHCREHHNGFRDAIEKLVLSYERLRG